MITKLILPKAGMGTTEGTIVSWLKAEGESVTEGEILVEVETAKAVEELSAPVSGVLTKILVAEDETIEVHAELALIESDD